MRISKESGSKADQIAAQLKIDPQADDRLKAALLTEINELCVENGDTYTTAQPLLNQTLQLLENARNVQIDPSKLADQLVVLAKENKIVGDENRIYLRGLYEAEWRVAEHLQRLLAADNDENYRHTPWIGLSSMLAGPVILPMMNHKPKHSKPRLRRLFSTDRGPGTGKTTIIRGLVALYAELHDVSLDINQYKDKPFPILLAAPTGRAAKRMAKRRDFPLVPFIGYLG